MRCPTFEEITTQALALLPRGRAWQTSEMGYNPDSVLYRYWRSVASVYSFLTDRLCALRLEFWCATHTETHDLWMEEYGLPDGCDPFPDLCVKVAALGGATCDYYTDAAARIGWTIGCSEDITICGAQAGCDLAGEAIAGNYRREPRLIIDVDIAKSPAYTAGFEGLAHAGCAQAGGSLSCFPDITSLICLLERIVQAHVEIVYNIISPPTYIMVDDEVHLTDGDALLIA